MLFKEHTNQDVAERVSYNRVKYTALIQITRVDLHD